jgi:steroid delta-isomerase-like uncharacterized protein
VKNETCKAICRRFIQEIFNQGELSRIRDFVAADAWNHEVGDEPAPAGHSPEYFAGLVRLYREAFPDLQIEIKTQVAEEDRVVTCLRLKGTQKNPLLGIPSRGKAMEVEGIRIDRFVDDKIAESWFQWDSVGMLRQLGVLPNLWEGKAVPAAEPASMPSTVWYMPVPEAEPAMEHQWLKAS